MRKIGLEAIYPKPNLSKAKDSVRKYPYLLKEEEITVPNQVWSTDITYIRAMGKAFAQERYPFMQISLQEGFALCIF
ncbi:hypothetical protein TUMEXPCC7403_13615 [Tumidithrix helvetica PCC 7403]